VAEGQVVAGGATATSGATPGLGALGHAELRRWEALCRSGEGDELAPWPEAESRDLVDAVMAGLVEDDGSMLEPATRAWAECTSPMPVLVRRLGCLRETFAEVGLLIGEGPAQRLAPVLDKVTMLATETAMAGLEDAALTDPLTGAGNRRAMESAGRAALASSARTGAPLSVVVMDLDGLKTLNDTRGHAAGDQALAALAGGLRATLRDTDQLFRVGGDEFVALLPLAPAAAVAELMQRAQRSGAPSFSWGVASAPGDGTELASLVHTADGRLYAARRAAGYYSAASASAPPSPSAPASAPGVRAAAAAPRSRRRTRAMVAAALLPVAAVVAMALALTSSSGPKNSSPGATGTTSVPAPGTGRAGSGGSGSAPGSHATPPRPNGPTGPQPGSPGATTGTAGTSPPAGSGGPGSSSTTTSPSTTTTAPGLLPGVTLPLGSGLPVITTLPTIPPLPLH